MHKAPAVSYPVGRSRWQLAIIVSLLSLACAVLFALFQGLASVLLQTFILIFVVGVAAVSVSCWLLSENEMLQWNGKAWWFSRWPDTVETHLSVILDLQFLTLVGLTSGSGKYAWLWIESQTFASKWLAVRRALVSSQQVNNDVSDRSDT